MQKCKKQMQKEIQEISRVPGNMSKIKKEHGNFDMSRDQRMFS